MQPSLGRSRPRPQALGGPSLLAAEAVANGGLEGGVVGPLSVSGPGYLMLPPGRLPQRAGHRAGAGPRPFPPNDSPPALFPQCQRPLSALW